MFIHTVPLPAPEALKILEEEDHVFLFWKSLAVKDRTFNESRVRNQIFIIWAIPANVKLVMKEI